MENNSSGLTLIETVIALSLVVVLATAFAGAMLTGLKSEKTTNNLDKAVNLAASTFDYFDQEFETVLLNIELSGDSYRKTLENFKNELNNSYFTNNIYTPHTGKLDYNSTNSEIIIEKINEDLELYNVKLIISWGISSERGSYELESIFGGSYE